MKVTVAAVACAICFAAPAQASTFKVIHNFCSEFQCEDGADPGAGLLMDSSGNLYGTTESGPSGLNSGVVYELSPKAGRLGWKSRTLHKFCYGCTNDGSNPNGELIIDTAGNLYGTTNTGGSENGGTVFELQHDQEHRQPIFTMLYSFSRFDPGGVGPVGALSYSGAASGAAYDGVSSLYGVTEEGGNDPQQGVVFSLTPNGGNWDESMLYTFCSLANCADGYFPLAGVVVDGNGSIFGTTADGGQQDRGIVFQLTESGGKWNETVLHSFCLSGRHCHDGAVPRTSLAMDASGALIGTTEGGGNHMKGCCGLVYKLVPNGTDSQYTVLHDFCAFRDCKDGANPRTGMLIDASGNLYGATFSGGGHNSTSTSAGGGTIYKLSGTTLETLHAFCSERDCADGQNPIGNIVMDGAGDIFGVTQAGGKFGRGVVFEISP